MWLIASAKNGISLVELGRRLRVKQTSAWAMKQRISEPQPRCGRAAAITGAG
jgi:hypothetical protein